MAAPAVPAPVAGTCSALPLPLPLLRCPLVGHAHHVLSPELRECLALHVMRHMQDPVFSIREAAINVLQAIAKEFGPDWAREHILPQVGLTPQHVSGWGLPVAGSC